MISVPYSWRLMLAGLLAILLFMSLGCWQLKRGQEKKALLTAFSEQQEKAALAWQEGEPYPKPYEQRRLKGQYLPVQFYLDNQHHVHEVGYDVLTPFQLDKGGIILIDRGFRSRKDKPLTSGLQGELQTITGQIYFPSAKAFLLGLEIEQQTASSWLIQRINPPLIAQVLHKTVYPFIMRLNKEEPNGFIREWPIVAMPPERHVAYALQWFGMALVLLIIMIVNFFKK